MPDVSRKRPQKAGRTLSAPSGGHIALFWATVHCAWPVLIIVCSMYGKENHSPPAHPLLFNEREDPEECPRLYPIAPANIWPNPISTQHSAKIRVNHVLTSRVQSLPGGSGTKTTLLRHFPIRLSEPNVGSQTSDAQITSL